MSKTMNFLIVLVVADLLAGGLIWYGATNMQSKKDEQATLQKQIEEEKSKGKQLSSLRGTLLSVQDEYQPLNKYFYDATDDGLLSFVSQLETYGAITNATVNTNGVSLNQSGQKSFHAELQFSGKWPQVYHLLRILETFPGRIVINHLQLTGDSQSPPFNMNANWSGTVSIDMVTLK